MLRARRAANRVAHRNRGRGGDRLGCWYWYASRQRPAAATPVVAAPAPPPVSTEPQIEHPIAADNAAGSAALPALNDSDQIVDDSLAGVLGRHAVEQFLVPQNIVRHLVATVDNLPRRKVAAELRPVKPAPGQSAIATQVRSRPSATPTFERYAPLVRVVQATDVKHSCWSTSGCIRCSSRLTRTWAIRQVLQTIGWSR